MTLEKACCIFTEEFRTGGQEIFDMKRQIGGGLLTLVSVANIAVHQLLFFDLITKTLHS